MGKGSSDLRRLRRHQGLQGPAKFPLDVNAGRIDAVVDVPGMLFLFKTMKGRACTGSSDNIDSSAYGADAGQGNARGGRVESID